MTHNNKRIPHYLQIRSFITDQIDKHILQSGDRLPSENDLAAKFGVSRITVKNALDSLVKQGIIHRIQGKGSFVSSKQGVPILYEKKSTSIPLIYYIAPSMENSFTARLLKGAEKELFTFKLQGYFFNYEWVSGKRKRADSGCDTAWRAGNIGFSGRWRKIQRGNFPVIALRLSNCADRP